MALFGMAKYSVLRIFVVLPPPRPPGFFPGPAGGLTVPSGCHVSDWFI